MIKGLAGGVAAGAAVVGFGLVVLSQMAPAPAPFAPQTQAGPAVAMRPQVPAPSSQGPDAGLAVAGADTATPPALAAARDAEPVADTSAAPTVPSGSAAVFPAPSLPGVADVAATNAPPREATEISGAEIPATDISAAERVAAAPDIAERADAPPLPAPPTPLPAQPEVPPNLRPVAATDGLDAPALAPAPEMAINPASPDVPRQVSAGGAQDAPATPAAPPAGPAPVVLAEAPSAATEPALRRDAAAAPPAAIAPAPQAGVVATLPAAPSAPSPVPPVAVPVPPMPVEAAPSVLPDAVAVVSQPPISAARPQADPPAVRPADVIAAPVPGLPPPAQRAPDPEPPPQALPDPDLIIAEAAPPAPILSRPAPLAPAPGFGTAQGIATGRLPRIVADSGAGPDPDTDPGPVAEAPGAQADDPAAPPLRRYARPFDNPAGKPLMAFVLIDTGEPTLDRKALASLPFPVTFAIDPSMPGADLAASIYRDGGQEVAILARGVPRGAQARDVEVMFDALSQALPEAVVVMDDEGAGFQDNRVIAGQVIPVVKGQGRGLLSWDRGLNSAAQVARREGLAAATILRRIDAEGASAPTMRRYLDRAAFKAVQDGRVVVAGTTTADTVAVMLAWMVEGRASSVALAPVSAVVRP